MRTIPFALQAKLDSGATTLCRCWILTRRDGVVQGFTDHDQTIVVNSVSCRADTGFTGSEAVTRLGLSVDGTEVSGALSDDTLNESALAAGHYDAARVDMYIVDWSEPALNVLMTRGHIGEVRREGAAWPIRSRMKRAGFIQRPAAPTLATCVARSISMILCIAVRESSFRWAVYRLSRSPVWMISMLAGSPPGG